MAMSEEEKIQYHRISIQDELLLSEKAYVKHLEEIVTSYLQPLREKKKCSNVKPEQISSIFSNIEMIYKFHQSFLAELKVTKDCAVVFIKYADFLKMYTQYLNEYEKGMKTLSDLRQNKNFQIFLNDIKYSKDDGQSLTALLIMPVQRIPRYEMLLKDLLKYTPESDPRHQSVTEAFDKITVIAKHINEEKRTMENLSQLIEIQDRILGHYTLLKPSRHFLRENTFGYSSSSQGKQKIRNVFLFNDLLLWTTDDSFEYKGHVDLVDITISEWPPQKVEDLIGESSPTSTKDKYASFKAKIKAAISDGPTKHHCRRHSSDFDATTLHLPATPSEHNKRRASISTPNDPRLGSMVGFVAHETKHKKNHHYFFASTPAVRDTWFMAIQSMIDYEHQTLDDARERRMMHSLGQLKFSKTKELLNINNPELSQKKQDQEIFTKVVNDLADLANEQPNECHQSKIV